eukprot:gi/632981363/ref/XP_007907549.1/ PREDICTED: cadherin-related family member 5 isoform X2 [Callorhinchus milii]
MKTKHLLQCYRGLWLFLCFFLSLQSVVNPLQCSQFNACCVDDLILVVPEDKQPQAVISPIVKKSTDITVTIKNQVDVPMLTIIGDNLVLKDSIDYESPGKKVLDVKFLCSSTNSPEESLDFYFQITNVNDNPPKFPNTVMDVEIGELFPIGPWITVSANDADGDPIAYSLNPKSSGADYFILKNVNNAEISLNKALDYEEVKNLQLILQAEDQGNPPLKETATVTINIRVLDIDNKPPSFQPCKFPSKNICVNAVYSGDVTIKKPETGPLTLTPGPLYALDGDKVLNEPIVYEIIDGDQNNHFKIDATSGNITLVNVIDTLDPVVLTVMASQQNDKYKYTTTTVTIKVLEVNHNKPTFATQPYTGIVMLNSEVDSIVVEKGTKPLIVQAEDADFPAFFNPSITYEIKPSDKFKITRDGFIFTKVVLSNPGELIKLKIIALDETSKETAECDLEVQVSNADATTVRPTTGTGPTKPTNQPPGTGPAKPTNQPPGTGPAKPTNQPPGTGPAKPTNQPPGTGPAKPTNQPPGTGPAKPTNQPPGTGPAKPTNQPPGTGPAKPTNQPPGTGPAKPTNQPPGTGPAKPTNQPPGTGPAKPTNQPPGTGPTTAKAPIVSPGSSSPKPPAPGSTSATTTATTTVSGGSRPTKPPTQPPGPEPTHTGSTTLPQASSPAIKPTGAQSSTTKSPGSAGSTTVKSPGPGPGPGTEPVTGRTTSSSGPTYHPPSPGVTPDSTAKPGPPDGTATGSPSSYPTVDPSLVYGVKDMVALGVPLAILLLIALIVIAILLRKISKGKMEWKRIRKLSVAKRNAFGGSSNSTKPNGLQFVNEGYLEDDKPSGLEKGILKSSWTPTTNEASITALAAALEPKLEASVPTKASEKSKPQNNNSEDNEGDGDKEVKSILTKERKSDEGYKAVWFREDIDPEAKEERVIETGDDDDAEEMEEDKPGRNRGVSFAPEDDNDEQSYQL